MKKRLALMFFVGVAILISRARPETSGTVLVMSAHWDNNTNIQGTVAFSKINSSGPDTIIATTTLSEGWARLTEPLQPNSFYNVILRAENGSQLVQFPITTAFINPANLQRAEIDIVCRASDHSLASARIDVSMKF